MTALVTGGAGFIGSAVVRLLLDRGMAVRVLDNFSTGYRHNLDGLAVEVFEGDVRDAGLVRAAVANTSVVLHLAASVGNVKSIEQPQEDSEVNVLGTVNVLDEARRVGVERVVYSSSAATFGEPQSMPVSEDHPQNPDSPYGVSKLAGEKHALCFGRLYGITVVCLRYFNVYGVRQRFDAYGNVIPIFANRLLSGRPLTIYGDGKQTRDFVNVDDVAVANWLAATEAEGSGAYNVGSGRATAINDLARAMQEESGVSAATVERVAPRRGEVRHCTADISKISSDLGFVPTVPLRTGLKDYLEWFKNDDTVERCKR